LKSFELAIIENVQRENLSIIEEADSYKKLIKEYSYSHEEVALKVGFSRSRITNALRLLKLPKDIQDLISKNGISYGHARALIKSENQHEIVELILKESLSVRDVEDLVQKKGKYQKDYKDRAVKIPLNPEFVEFFKNNNLVPSLKEKDGKGCLVLKYKDKQDLDDLLSKILNAV
jgi:ParB family chromosome partitioning protein